MHFSKVLVRATISLEFCKIIFTSSEISAEQKRLFSALERFDFSEDDCERMAHTTLEIARLKKEKKAILLAHSYQTPDILAIADEVGDSYGLAKKAAKTDAEIIVFASVLFMGETAKILNPDKTVLVPARAGCSLADSITAADVRTLRKQYPGAGFVAYVNTSAAVKAEVDVCCTSSNALRIVEKMPQQQIVFLPDKLMGTNLQAKTSKELIFWNGVCTVHEEFSDREIAEVRAEFPQAQILTHPECMPSVVQKSDFVGSTEQMMDFVNNSKNEEFMLVTECGLADRARSTFPQKKIVGTCHLCPYMKQITLKNILSALKNPKSEQIVEIDSEVIKKAKKSLDTMFQLSE